MSNVQHWINARLSGHSVPLNVPEHQQDMLGMKLSEAINAHDAWRDRLEVIIRTKDQSEYDPAVVSADHLCAVGKWLYGSGKMLDVYPEYQRFVDIHAKFHQCAGKIIEDHRKGYLVDAITALRGEFIELSNQVGAVLAELYIAMHDHK